MQPLTRIFYFLWVKCWWLATLRTMGMKWQQMHRMLYHNIQFLYNFYVSLLICFENHLCVRRIDMIICSHKVTNLIMSYLFYLLFLLLSVGSLVCSEFLDGVSQHHKDQIFIFILFNNKKCSYFWYSWLI